MNPAHDVLAANQLRRYTYSNVIWLRTINEKSEFKWRYQIPLQAQAFSESTPTRKTTRISGNVSRLWNVEWKSIQFYWNSNLINSLHCLEWIIEKNDVSHFCSSVRPKNSLVKTVFSILPKPWFGWTAKIAFVIILLQRKILSLATLCSRHRNVKA